MFGVVVCVEASVLAKAGLALINPVFSKLCFFFFLVFLEGTSNFLVHQHFAKG